jgi:hypothetical protein
MASRLARLAQSPSVRTPQRQAPGALEEHCDMCAAPVPPGHRHVVDLTDRRLMCVCRACALLFDSAAAGGGHLRLLPTGRLEDFVLEDASWDRLRIPVDMAFFFRNTEAERVSAFYPSPAGPTESLLELEAWTELEAANPVLREMEPDVEALLVSRAREMREHWIVPIDDCYELVGLIRTHWRGFGGGEEVWSEIKRFFGDLPTREQTRW